MRGEPEEIEALVERQREFPNGTGRVQGVPAQRVWHGTVTRRAGALVIVEIDPDDPTSPPVGADVQVVVGP